MNIRPEEAVLHAIGKPVNRMAERSSGAAVQTLMPPQEAQGLRRAIAAASGRST